MTLPNLPFEIPESERTPLVNWLLQVIEQQQGTIAKLEEKVTQLEAKVGSLDEELKAAKKLKGKPQIRPSTLNQEVPTLPEGTSGRNAAPSLKLPKPAGKRPGSDKRSKKTDFVSTANVAQGEAAWQAYLQGLDITSQQAVKLLTEAALLGSAIEHGLSPDLIILSDGAKQFAILSHALCWVHYLRGIRRLPGSTAQHRQEIEAVQSALWDYYRQLKDYQDKPSEIEKERLLQRFDEIFGQRYPHHYGLNLAMQQFCTHKEELLRVLDTPQVPLHTNAAEADIREYVTRRKISGGTRHDDGRRARDTFTGLKKTPDPAAVARRQGRGQRNCRKLAYSFWQYLLSRWRS